jgi:RimJ/RimL family protein N-acetyltransferase
MQDGIPTAARSSLAADLSCIETRSITADDREALAGLFGELSPESRYRRFLSGKAELTPRELDWLTAVDHVNHEAIVAVDRRDGSMVAVCRYVHDRERPGVVEVAFAVVDGWQGMGIGTILAEQILHRARDNGMALVTAVTLRRNPPAHALLRRLGFRTVRRHDGGNDLNWELPCRPPALAQILSLPPARPRDGW